MPTVFERTVEKKIILNLAEKCSLGEIVLKVFYAAGYNKNQTALYRSDEPEGYFQVINYPDSFTDKIDQCIEDFNERKLNPPLKAEKVTKSVTPKIRKRIPLKPTPVKTWSAKPENPTQKIS